MSLFCLFVTLNYHNGDLLLRFISCLVICFLVVFCRDFSMAHVFGVVAFGLIAFSQSAPRAVLGLGVKSCMKHRASVHQNEQGK